MESRTLILLAGLGNPDAKYSRNRHNVGFMAMDALVERWGTNPWRQKFHAHFCEGQIGRTDGVSERLLFVKPQTYYNESGRAVSEAMKFHNLNPSQVIVFHDEIDLAPGRFRMKLGGGAAGNNGIRSVTSQIGPDFRRGRIGVGHPGDRDLVMPHVLGDFQKAELDWLRPLLEAIGEALPFAVQGEDERFQAEVMRLAPAPKPESAKQVREPRQP
jgi:PTH1 family peptidyl-tRNA hydrolase